MIIKSKNLTLIIIVGICLNFSCSKKKEWSYFSEEKVEILQLKGTDSLTVENLDFKSVWDYEMNFSDNIGYYGGIDRLSIYKNDKLIQVITEIDDNIALGYITFWFYDFNFDGYLDFRIPANDNWYFYYIFNPKLNKFEYKNNWDVIKIQKIDKTNKQILTQPDGNYQEDTRKLYQVKGSEVLSR